MKIFILCFFAIFLGVLSEEEQEEEDCLMKELNDCKKDLLIVNEVDCDILSDTKKCMAEFIDNCFEKPIRPASIHHLRSVEAVINNICGADSNFSKIEGHCYIGGYAHTANFRHCIVKPVLRMFKDPRVSFMNYVVIMARCMSNTFGERCGRRSEEAIYQFVMATTIPTRLQWDLIF